MASSTEANTGREEPPPSKKRVALRQISKDQPDSDDEEDAGGGSADGGTFRRASDEVLAERRIVKVRRTAGAAAPSSMSNPFAAVCLVPPTIPPVVSQEPPPPLPIATTNLPNSGPSLATPAAGGELRLEGAGGTVTEQDGSLEVVQPEAAEAPGTIVAALPVSVENVVELVPEENVLAGTVVLEEKMDEAAAAVSNEEDASNGDGEAAKGRNSGELVSSSGKSSETFEQLSSAKNAFAGAGLGSFGTGFSPSASSVANSTSGGFSFGGSQPSFTFGGSGPFTFGSSGGMMFGGGGQSPGSLGLTTTTTTTTTSSQGGAFPSVSSVFGTSSNGTGAPPIFGGGAISGTAAGSQAPNKPSVVSLQEVHVETGEEKEKAVFTADAALFEFLDGGWKERGKGELKLNVSEEKDKKPRLVMRAKGNYRLLLNASLFPDMKLSKMDNRGISFVCANSAAAPEAGKSGGGLATYAVRLKDSVVASEFTATVQAHKGSTSSPNNNHKTPESSPKSSPKSNERPASKEEEGVPTIET